MRKLSFRGKRADGEWVYGYYAKFAHDSVPVILEDTENGIAPRKIIPDTVGQFTGLHDKNGKEIYEGDVYRFEHPDSINEVSYCIGGGFAGFDFAPAFTDNNRLTNIEVIGNIHDNPELLKGGNDEK